MLNETNKLAAGVKRRVFALARRLVRRLVPRLLPRLHSAEALPAGPPARILVMQLQQLGDSVIFTPTLRALRERFPTSRLDMLVNPVSWQIYKKSPHVDRFWIARSWHAGPGGSRLRPMLPLLREIRREGYDLVVACITQSAFKYSLVAWLTGARIRVGFDVEDRGFLYTMPLRYREDAKWIDCNLDAARAFGVTSTSWREEVHFDHADVAHVEALLLASGIAGADPLVVMHTGSNWQSRTWYDDRWAALADAMVERHGASIVFVGGPGDREGVETIRRLMRHGSVSLAGRTDIPQLAALLRRADLFVGTDSGPRHIAGATGTPHVTLMGSQDASDRWVGFREGEVILRTLPQCAGCGIQICGHKTCMDLIAVGQVLATCGRVLADARPSAHGVAR